MFAFRIRSQRLRQIAWMTLFAWLFALTAGVVNACLLPGAVTRGQVAAPAAHSSRSVVDTEHHDRGPVAHHEHQQNNTNDSCLKFCDDESSALPKDNTSTLDPGIASVFAAVWLGAVVPITHIGTGLSVA